MGRQMQKVLKELWARKVVQFGVVYLGAAWMLLQVSGFVENALELPNWVDQIALVLLGLGFPVALILAWAQESQATPLDDEASSGQNSAAQDFEEELPHEKASIAVLPFVNMSDDPDKEFLADGMTEDIITRLSFSSHLSVISRTSTFEYKGQSVDVRKVGEALKVDYVAEGSVRPVGSHLRFTVQLINAQTGDHIWAEKYDRPAEDLFVIQDEVIDAITGALGIHLTRAETERAKYLKPESISAWEAVHRNGFLKSSSEDMRQELSDVVTEMLEVAEREPDYAPLQAAIAAGLAGNMLLGWSDDLFGDLARVDQHVQRALALAPEDNFNLFYCATTLSWNLRFDEALELCERSLKVNPNFVDIYFPYGFCLMLTGRFEEAEAAFNKAEAGGFPSAYPGWLQFYRGILYLISDRFSQAVFTLRDAAARMPSMEIVPMLLSWALFKLGRVEEAQAAVDDAIRRNPDYLHENAMLICDIHPDPEKKLQAQADITSMWPKDRLPEGVA